MGIFGGMNRSIVATPQQKAESEYWARKFGFVTPDINENELPQQAPMPEQQQAPRQGFWNGGDKFGGRDALAGILAVVGDAIARQSGGEGGAVNMLGGGRLSAIQMAREAQMAEAQRMQKMQDFAEQERIKSQYKVNDTEADFAFIARTLGEDKAREWLARKGDPMVNMTLPNNQFYSGPQSGLSSALGLQVPTAPVGKLKPLGGGSGNAVGGFRPYR